MAVGDRSPLVRAMTRDDLRANQRAIDAAEIERLWSKMTACEPALAQIGQTNAPTVARWFTRKMRRLQGFWLGVVAFWLAYGVVYVIFRGGL